MKFQDVLVLLVLLVGINFTICPTPAAAQLVPYWIPDDGCWIVREGAYGTEYYKGVANSLGLLFTANQLDYRFDQYTWDGNDGLCLASQKYPGMESSTYNYNPPLKVLQLPLTPGLTWTSESVRSRQGGGRIPRTHTLTSTVVGPQIIDSVLGPLEVIEVTQVLTVSPGGGEPQTFTRLLNAQFGDIHGLLDFNGCTTVTIDAVSWGVVKSLYR